MMRTLRRWFFASFLVLASCAGALVLLLRHPAGFFAHVCDEGDLVLYSDRSFAAADARVVLAAARAKLRTSPWYRAGRHDAVFVCNAAWRRRLFCFGAPRAGGLNYVPLTANVFLSGARVEENRLVSPTGRVVEDERTLDYFIAHEIAHSLTCERLGAWRYVRLPDWLREGYADYVGRGSVLGRPEAAAAFLREDPEMNWPAAAPYLRYNLMTGFLLEREHRPLETVFAEPEQRLTVEGRLRAWLQRAAHGS